METVIQSLGSHCNKTVFYKLLHLESTSNCYSKGGPELVGVDESKRSCWTPISRTGFTATNVGYSLCGTSPNKQTVVSTCYL